MQRLKIILFKTLFYSEEALYDRQWANHLKEIPQKSRWVTWYLFWAQSYKTFLSLFYKYSQEARVFVPGKLLKTILTYTLA